MFPLRSFAIFYSLALLLLPACGPRQLMSTANQKIGFDYTTLDASGLRNGEVAVDYEYCIPADDASFSKVQHIDPGVRLMKTSKGRIGCSASQWLCISSTHDPAWKEKLMAIAALDFVERMEETVWE